MGLWPQQTRQLPSVAGLMAAAVVHLGGGRGRGCLICEGMCRPTAVFHPCHKHTHTRARKHCAFSVCTPIPIHPNLQRLRSPVSVLVKGHCSWESQHSAGDAAAAEVPAVAAHVTPLATVLHLEHAFCHQAAMVAGQDRPEASLVQLDQTLNKRKESRKTWRHSVGFIHCFPPGIHLLKSLKERVSRSRKKPLLGFAMTAAPCSNPDTKHFTFCLSSSGAF